MSADRPAAIEEGISPAFNGGPAAAHFNANGIEGWCDGLAPPDEGAA